jgi:hypothetical protein
LPTARCLYGVWRVLYGRSEPKTSTGPWWWRVELNHRPWGYEKLSSDFY